jgi:hypothetical protein
MTITVRLAMSTLRRKRWQDVSLGGEQATACPQARES